MNAASCQAALQGVGSGVAASLQGVDCAANAMAQAAFGRLFAPNGALVPVLTILLTLYVAFFAFALITGRSRVGVSALTPRMMTLGLVLTFATSWAAYSQVVWNLATGAPDQIAGILMGIDGSATRGFADKIDVVFGALIQASGGEAMQAPQSAFSPPGLMWFGGTLLLLGTVGVLVTTKIALSVLLALGPVFVVLALFSGTRGLFTGWLKGVVLLSIAPMLAVLSGSLMLELAVPVLSALAATPGQIDPRAAMGFFLIGAVHASLMILVMKVAGAMVAGWRVFGLAGSERDSGRADSPARTQVERTVAPAPRAEIIQGALASSRQIRLASIPASTPANDTAPASVRRETKVIGTAASAAPNPIQPGAVSRAHGIGSRFRAAPARSTEMLK
ncbi:type IV secretion system protein [Altericroceibacterium xinjiangense]|uniref:type IV secretion system protein n=1 Tax=Altericroceibacterium xinjiangense TaxID=762261 RepID=UPI000F7D7211|nr:type IV secretion system protein [Altericroceibacterium xinjiangense]